MDPFIGEIRVFAGNFAPKGWAFCNGDILPIRAYTALFSLLGVSYGGNGTTTFALPNLKGTAPMGAGQGPGLSSRSLGDTDGEATHTLTNSELPAHNHAIACTGGPGTLAGPKGNYFAGSQEDRGTGIANDTPYDPASDSMMSPALLLPNGGSGAHNNMQPYLGINYIIALDGIFPTRP